MLFHQTVLCQNKWVYVQTMINYKENEAISSIIIFKGLTLTEEHDYTTCFCKYWKN